MIQLKEAQKTKFKDSTRIELRGYAKELGISEDIPESADAAMLRNACLRALGLTSDSAPVPRQQKQQGKVDEKNVIFPTYNVSTDGVWGGRRHRVTLPRPEGSKMAKAEGFSWNGKHTYYIAYDEPQDIPEPIYNMLIANKRRRAVTVDQRLPDGTVEKTTQWEFDNIPMSYMGVTRGTENLAGSLTEWYQARGTAWFAERTMRQLQLIADKIGLPKAQNVGPGLPARILDEAELRQRLVEFFFSFADVDVPEDKGVKL